jgi:Leucine-rich repeat (LRR) protein
LTGLNSFDLSGNNLTTLPSTISCQQQLRFLALGGNKFSSLPESNDLTSFLERLGYTPETITKEQLSVSSNQDPSTWPSYWSMRLSSEEQRIISS